MNELQRLRERIDQLEELLGLHEKVAIHFVHENHQARVEMVIRLLASREMISEAAIGLAIGVDDLRRKSAAVYICYARKALRPHEIEIKCDFMRGWYVSAADKAKLRAVMRGGSA